MTVRLIERFSESLPDWLKDAIKNTNDARTYNVKRRSYIDGDAYETFYDYVKNGITMKGHVNYPLDTLTFEERPIPKTMASIRRDFEAGYDPVLKIKPRYNYGDDSERDFTVCIVHHTADRRTSDATQFKNSFEDAVKLALGYGPKWNEIKDRIIGYGVIANADEEVRNLNTKRRERSINRKYWQIPDPSVYEDELRQKRRRMKVGAFGLKMFKQLDALYDDIMETFDKALEKIETVSDDRANDIFYMMKLIKQNYETAICYIEDIMYKANPESGERFWNDSPENYGFARRTQERIDTVEGLLNGLKEKIR